MKFNFHGVSKFGMVRCSTYLVWNRCLRLFQEGWCEEGNLAVGLIRGRDHLCHLSD